jgi:hypothetical protein
MRAPPDACSSTHGYEASLAMPSWLKLSTRQSSIRLASFPIKRRGLRGRRNAPSPASPRGWYTSPLSRSARHPKRSGRVHRDTAAILNEALCLHDRVECTSPWAEAVTEFPETWVQYRLQDLRQGLLNDTVEHGRDADLAHLTVTFRNQLLFKCRTAETRVPAVRTFSSAQLSSAQLSSASAWAAAVATATTAVAAATRAVAAWTALGRASFA